MRGNATTTETDAAGRPVRTLDAAGNATLVYEYDNIGNPKEAFEQNTVCF